MSIQGHTSSEKRVAMKQSQALMERNQSRQLDKVLIQGDLTGLTPDQRLDYANALCKAMGISLLFQPFEFIYMKRSGRTVCYAKRSCAEQLRKKHKISIRITSRERVDNLYVVTAHAQMGKREDEAIGAVNIGGLRGEDLANALLKAETKAKRRVTLSLCGLGMLDEVEARETAEREAEEESAQGAVAVQEKIAETKERPEFESIQTQDANPTPTEESPTPTEEYRIKTGKTLRGKPVSSISVNKLKKWIDWYVAYKGSGQPLSTDADDDAFHIKAHLDLIERDKGTVTNGTPKEGES